MPYPTLRSKTNFKFDLSFGYYCHLLLPVIVLLEDQYAK